jgi:hypothetical protein
MHTDDGRYEAAVSAALQLTNDLDAHRWDIGDLAAAVRMAYGQDRMGQFANDIGLPKPTVSEYKLMAQFYPKSARAEFPANMTYSHAREARKLVRKLHKDEDYETRLDAALVFLEAWGDDGLTVGQAQVEVTRLTGKRVTPGKLLDVECEVYLPVPPTDEMLGLYAADVDWSALEGGKRYRVVVYPVDDESGDQCGT